MDGGGVGGETIDNCHFDHVAPVGYDWLSRRFSVDGKLGRGDTVVDGNLLRQGQDVFLGLAGVKLFVRIGIDRLACTPLASVVGVVAARLGKTANGGGAT